MKLRRVLALVVALAFALATQADAELAEKGDLFVRFDGGISPRALPRSTLAPVAVRIEGTIKTPARRDPPALRGIQVELNRGGHLDPHGLPICHRRQIVGASPGGAVGACGRSLLGGGGYDARTTFSGQPPTTVHGEILLFNSITKGRESILAHFFQRSPAPISRVVAFHVRHTTGTFGTVIRGTLPPGLNRNGYLKSIYLQMQRRFTVRGRQHSYISASCSAPAGIRVAAFPFARASMTFEDGRTLSSRLTRTCQVRE